MENVDDAFQSPYLNDIYANAIIRKKIPDAICIGTNIYNIYHIES